MSEPDRLTPARRQYLTLKKKHPDALLLFRMGDFYELFDDDAITASRDLHITLTSREFGKGNRVPMAGVPHHALGSYLRRLLAKGHRVAIGEQLSEAGHGLVDRDVVKVLSPGTVVEPGLLSARENNYLVALNPGRTATGLALVDVSTGEFAVTEFPESEAAALIAELARLAPAECLVPEGRAPAQTPACPLTVCPPRWFQVTPARERLLRHFGLASLEPFGCDAMDAAIGAAAAVLAYVEGTNRDLLRLLRSLRTYSTSAYVTIDAYTRRNLEITRSARSGERSGSLLSALDHTNTAMGGRLLRRWLNRPLRDMAALNARLDVVEALTTDAGRRTTLRTLLERCGDLERLTGRARQGIAAPRDLLALAAGLRAAAAVQAAIAPNLPAPFPAREGGDRGYTVSAASPSLDHQHEDAPPKPQYGHTPPSLAGKGAGGLGALAVRIHPLPDVADLIERAVSEQDGRPIRPGFDAELDELVTTVSQAQRTLVAMEARERERTGIRSLKVSFNKVFGYYIEVTKANLRHVPQDFIRRQTLANCERFVTPELKEWEARILRAEERIETHARAVFTRVTEQVGAHVDRLLATAEAIAELDVLCTFAELAVQRRYVRPLLDDSTALHITGGRHPVVELSLEDGAFVANDVSFGETTPPPGPLPTGFAGREGERDGAQLGSHLGTSALGTVAQPHTESTPLSIREDGKGSHTEHTQEPLSRSAGEGQGWGPPRLLLITGPNMAGKSTYLRQVALIVLMAQVGSFVPADAATIGLVDRIFTRVGAQDDLAAGASTFLVEMVETAAILRHATPRSLLVLDEIGRGTSTFDGLAIAQAVIEDVHDRIGARTLFATHFHELTVLTDRLPHMRNLNAAAIEEDGRVVFLRRIVPGGADRSYGIHVARLAGLPEHVTARAHDLLAGLEATARPVASTRAVAPRIAEAPGRYISPSDGCPDCAAECESDAIHRLRSVNLAATTPMEAMNLLFSLQEALAGETVCDHQAHRPRLAVIEPPRAAVPWSRASRDGAHLPSGPP